MGLFRRRPSPEQVRAQQAEAITAFWSWWAAQGRDHAAEVFDGDGDHDVRPLGAAIAERVEAIHPELSFETGAGRTARHALVVTAAGDRELRDVARRWLAAAPPADDVFEYADARRPVADPSGVQIRFEDQPAVDLASATVVTLVEDGKVHLQMSHPAFGSLPDRAQAQITFLFLDAVLGEDVVEDWIGEISWVAGHDRPATPLLELPALVDEVVAAS